MFCTKIVLVDEYSCSIFILTNCCNYNTFLHSLKKNIFSSKNITAGVWKLWEKKPKPYSTIRTIKLSQFQIEIPEFNKTKLTYLIIHEQPSLYSTLSNFKKFPNIK